MASFVPRAVFPTLDSLPRSYYLGHHASGLAKMRRLLNHIDFVIECRDYRIPLTSRNPMFEEVLADRQRIVVYTKADLGANSPGRSKEDVKRRPKLRELLKPSPVCYSDSKSQENARAVLRLIKKNTTARDTLTGAHCMVVGMPNVGKSTLLNALRQVGVRKGKAAKTGAQPGVTRKIGTGVKIVEGVSEHDDVFLLDTPGVFIPYVPDADAMLKLALVGSVKDNIIPPFTLADYLLFHLNNVNPDFYSTYHEPTNEVTYLLQAMARKTGRLQKGGEFDLEGTAMWMVQQWRNGKLGRFVLDEVTNETIAKYRDADVEKSSSLSQARKADKEAIRARARVRKAEAGG